MGYEEFATQYRQGGYPEYLIRQEWDKQDAGVVTNLARGLGAGLTQMAEGVGSGLRFFGADELGSTVQDYWSEVGKGLQPQASIQGSIMDDPGLLAKPDWWAYNLGQMAPFTASMFIPGIGAARGAQALGMGARAAGMVGTGVGAATGGFFEAMPEYSQSLEQGMDPTEARLRAGATGLAIGALNTIPLSRAFGPGGLAKRVATTGLAEGATEWAEEPTTAAIYGRDIGEAAYQGVNVIPPSVLMGMLGAGSVPKSVRRQKPIQLPDDSPLLAETISKPDRGPLREQIINDIVSRGTPSEEPTAYLMGGGSAAGKGTLLEGLMEAEVIPRDAVAIDPDAIKAELPEFKTLAAVGDVRAADVTHEESSLIASEAMTRAVADKKDIVLDKTMGNPQKAAQLISSLKDAGYKVELFGVTVDTREALRRADERGKSTGRYVDPDALVSAHQGFSAGFEQYSGIVDRAYLYETGGGVAEEIARAENGSLEVLDNERYSKFRRKADEAQATTPPQDAEAAPANAGPAEGYQAPAAEAETQEPGVIPSERLNPVSYTPPGEMQAKAEKAGADRFESFFDKTAKRILMEEQGQDILYNLEESGISPKTVSDAFWKDTYPALNPRMQEKFKKYLISLTGWEPGSVVAVNTKTGEKTTANTWTDIAKYAAEDFPSGAEGLEGSERGYVSLMSWAKDKQSEGAPAPQKSIDGAVEESGGNISGPVAFNYRNPKTLEVTEERKPPTITLERDAFYGGDKYTVQSGPTTINAKIAGNTAEILYVTKERGEQRRLDDEIRLMESAIADLKGRGITRIDARSVFNTNDELGAQAINRLMKNGTLSGPVDNLRIGEPGTTPDSAVEIESAEQYGAIEGGEKIGAAAANPGKYSRLLDIKPRIQRVAEGQYSLVPAKGEQASALAASIDDLVAAGMPESWLKNFDNLGALLSEGGEHGSFVPSWDGIGISDQLLKSAAIAGNKHAQRSLRFTLAHELTHTVDIDRSGVNDTSASPLFSIDYQSMSEASDPVASMGEVVSEVFEYYRGEDSTTDGLDAQLNYPLASIASLIPPDGKTFAESIKGYDTVKQLRVSQKIKGAIDWIQAETFAQLGAIYFNYPKIMERRLPKAYALFSEVTHATAKDSTHERRAGLRQAIRAPSTTKWANRPQPAGAAEQIPGGRGADTGIQGSYPGAGLGGRGTDGPVVFRQEYVSKDPKYAGNINLDKYGRLTPEAETVIRNTAEMFDSTKARRGVVSWEETEALADTLGANAKDIAGRAVGEAWNSTDIERARRIIEESALETGAAARRAAETGNPDDIVRANEMMLQHATLQVPFSGVIAEAGRALNILRKMTSQAKNTKQVIEMDVSMEDKVAMLAELEETGQISNFARRASKVRASDVLFEIWINSLLSGPQTHVVNITSNALVDVFSNLENAVAAAIGTLHGGDKVTFSEVSARALGMVRGGLEGSRLAVSAFKTEETSGENKIEYARYQSIAPENFGVSPESTKGKAITKVGRTVRIPGRALMAMDEFFKSVARRSSLAGTAVREARKSGLTGTALAEEIKSLMNSPTDEMLRAAEEEAGYLTFTNRLGPFGRSFQALVAKMPVLRIIFPFIRTPTNIVKFASHRSPLMLVSAKWWRKIMTTTGAERDLMISRVVTGSSMMAAVAFLVAEGAITGGGPDDPRKREMMYRTGWQPYSVKDGDQWISYSRFEPLGMLFGISADLQEIASADDVENVVGMLIASVSKNIASKTWLRGLSEAVMALADPDRYGERWWVNLMGTAIPTGVAQVARVNDPILRDARTVTDRLLSRIPGTSDQIMPRRNTRGEPIVREGGIGPDILSPAYVSTMKDDPVAEELLRLGVSMSKPSRRIFKVKLTPEEYDVYQEEAGRLIESALQSVLSMPKYSSMPDEYRRILLERVILKARQRARFAVVRKMPQILGERSA